MDINTFLVLIVFCCVYAGMAFGRWPALAIDRTGIALFGATMLLFFGTIVGDTEPSFGDSVDTGTLAVLFGLMVLSAQFGGSGLYRWSAARLATSVASPAIVLGSIVVVTGALAALLANDIVVFAMTPILCQGLVRSGRDPRPYLLGHAGAANVGSAATLVGNPQNIIIGEQGGLDFWQYFFSAAPLAVIGLALVYLVVWAVWHRQMQKPAGNPDRPLEPPAPVIALDTPMLVKAILATLILLALYMTELPRWQSTLLVAGLLLISRRLTTRDMLGTVDWHLLVLFCSLFIVTGALGASGLTQQAMEGLANDGLTFDSPMLLGLTALVGSNTIGNVPLVILIMSALPEMPEAALFSLAVFSTFAGNLFIIGSLANLIVVERARQEGVVIGFVDHMRSGIPMTLATLALAFVWVLLIYG